MNDEVNKNDNDSVDSEGNSKGSADNKSNGTLPESKFNAPNENPHNRSDDSPGDEEVDQHNADSSEKNGIVNDKKGDERPEEDKKSDGKESDDEVDQSTTESDDPNPQQEETEEPAKSFENKFEAKGATFKKSPVIEGNRIDEFNLDNSSQSISELENKFINENGNIGSFQQILVKNFNSEDKNKIEILSVFKKGNFLEQEDFGDLNPKFSNWVDDLNEKRVLILGDIGDGKSRIVAHQIIDSIEGIHKDEQIRLISLADFSSKNEIMLQSFSIEREGEELLDAVIIFDATRLSNNKTFINSLLEPSVTRSSDYARKLRNNKLFFICLCDSIDIDDIEEINFKDSTRIPAHIVEEKKEKTIQKNDEAIDREVEDLINLDGDSEDIIVKTVLFVASFYPNLTANDFNHLVTKWLRDEPDALDENSIGNSEENVLTKISLVEIWNSKSHIFVKTCGLTQERDRLGKRVINFTAENFSEIVRKKLDSTFFNFVSEKVLDIFYSLLIFHPSENIGTQSIRNLSDYIREFEEQFLDWLLHIFSKLESKENEDEQMRELKKEVLRRLDISEKNNSGETEEIGEKYFYYNRLASLFRNMLKDASLKSIINRVFDNLLRNECYKSVLILIKRLDNARNFNRSKWLRQLFNKADVSTQKETKDYLFKRCINTNISEAFDELEGWLPKESATFDEYSEINKAALEVLIRYFSYQTGSFDEKLYGLEPSEFPLFNFENVSSANTELDKLTMYLVSPLNDKGLQDKPPTDDELGKFLLLFLLSSGNESLLNKFPHIFYIIFTLEMWWIILQKRETSEGHFNNSDLIDKEFLTNTEIKQKILAGIVFYSDKGNQRQILYLLEKHKEIIDKAIETPSLNWKDRKMASKERLIIRDLIKHYKKSRRLKKKNRSVA